MARRQRAPCTRAAQVMIGNSRTMFARHSQGYLFPILMNAQPMEACFAGCMQRLKSEDEFVWFYTKSFTVCGASQRSYSVMGVRVCECVCAGGGGGGVCVVCVCGGPQCRWRCGSERARE